jgi:hypothetical protein
MAGILGVVALVTIWPLVWRAMQGNDAKDVVMAALSIVVFVGLYLGLAFGASNRLDRWITARWAARDAQCGEDNGHD